LGGPLEGPVLPQGELSMVCVGLSERDLKTFGEATGGARQNFGGQWPPWHPPISAPATSTWPEKNIDKVTRITSDCDECSTH